MWGASAPRLRGPFGPAPTFFEKKCFFEVICKTCINQSGKSGFWFILWYVRMMYAFGMHQNGWYNSESSNQVIQTLIQNEPAESHLTFKQIVIFSFYLTQTESFENVQMGGFFCFTVSDIMPIIRTNLNKIQCKR